MSECEAVCCETCVLKKERMPSVTACACIGKSRILSSTYPMEIQRSGRCCNTRIDGTNTTIDA